MLQKLYQNQAESYLQQLQRDVKQRLPQILEQDLKLLRQMREDLSLATWTKHTMARSHLGVAVPPSSANAQCWCLYGAYLKIGGVLFIQSSTAWYLLEQLVGDNPVRYNDHPDTRLEDVHHLLDTAIELIQQCLETKESAHV